MPSRSRWVSGQRERLDGEGDVPAGAPADRSQRSEVSGQQMNPQPPLQPDLFAPTLQQQFETWADSAGGRHILNLLYRRAAGYAGRFKRTGRQVSIRLLWEQVRDHVSHYGPKLKSKLPAKIDGYRMNDHLHSFAARHILDHRPEWAGLFELREVGKARKKRRVLVIEERTEFHAKTPSRQAA